MSRLDVCLVVEGTWPYVAGGVSAWINDLLEGLSTLRFGVVHIGPGGDQTREPRYPMHDNVDRFIDVPIHDPDLPPERTAASPGPWLGAIGVGRRARRRAFALLDEFYRSLSGRLATGDLAGVDEALEVLGGQGELGLSMRDLLLGRESWDLLAACYDRYAGAQSFLDFFWTARYTHLPVLRLLRAPIPPACIYHAPSTGYAGFAAAIAARRTGAPLLLTEHGIYTKERKIEIQRSEWIYTSREGGRTRAERSLGFFKDWWIGLFDLMSRIAYRQASEVITLFEGNKELQVAGGAAPERCSVIPNGVDVDRFARLTRVPLVPPGAQPPPGAKETRSVPTVALVGRVVPIKDVKTFLRSAKLIAEALGVVDILIVGPTDEDEGYFRECLLTTQLLGLERVVRFTGFMDLRELFPRLDALVLTSISEGQPLVLLEAMAAGVPCVATDVGGCKELLLGRAPEDRALGPSGALCPVADPRAVSDAVVRIVRDPAHRDALANAGRARVDRWYRKEQLMSVYLELYERYRDRYLAGERFGVEARGASDAAAAAIEASIRFDEA